MAALAAAGFLSIVSTWLIIHGTGARGPDIFRVASSPVYHTGLALAFASAIWAYWLVDTRAAARSGAVFGLVMAAAVIMRLVALPAEPGLSDDIYRYLWDGQVQAAGINPYLHPPDSPALDPLASSYRPLINNPGLPTIYPPVSQLVFLLAALAGGTVAVMKGLLVLFDIGTILALAAILRRRGAAPARVVIYAWSPLAIIEVGWSGHQDSIGVCLLVVAVLGIIRGWGWVSTTAGALAGASKYIGWLVLPEAIRRAGWRSLAPAAAALALIYLPYASAGRGLAGSLAAYAERWRFNDSLFAALLAAVEGAGLSGMIRGLLSSTGWLVPGARWESSLLLRLTEPLSIAKGLAALIFLLLAARVLRLRWSDPVRTLLALTGTALLLSPVVHPWYLLWVAPLMALSPRASWIWLTYAAAALSYPMMAARMAGSASLDWLVWLEYLPFFAILAIESARRRLWEMDGEGWSRIV